MSTVSAKEFNRAPSAVKDQARQEPVWITERGRRSFVLLSAEDYARAVGDKKSIYDSLRPDDDLGIDFDPEPSINRVPIQDTAL